MTKKAVVKQLTEKQRAALAKRKSWKKGQSGNPKGRPLKIIEEIKKYSEGENIRIAKADLARVIEILMSKPGYKLKKWLDDRETSVYVQAIITSLGDSVRDSNIHKFRQIVEMLHGKPEQIITFKEEDLVIDPNMSPAEAMVKLQEIIKRK